MAFLFVLASIFVSIVTIFILLKTYIKLTSAWCKSQVCLVGKTAIITGANTGLGYETALDFAKRGARVILACRNAKKGQDAVDKIVKLTQNQNVVLKIVDMASLESVRQFAYEIQTNEPRLDILVNNAGAIASEPRNTVDGFLEILQVNYLSNFLLTYLLLDLLIKTGNSRIVNVSSVGARHAKLKIDRLLEDPGKTQIYFNTKLCQILFTKELAVRLQGTGVTAYSLHPGVVNTEIFKNLNRLRLVIFYLFKLLLKDAREGAQTIIYVSVAQNIEKYSGDHFEECHPVATYKTALNPNDPRKLWDKTLDVLKLQNKNEVIF